jgi:transcriptional regulator with XRE-family HTH domain
MTEGQLTPLGAALERAREETGISKTRAARAAGFSRSTWDTLTRGYISRQGRHDPVTPKLENVTAAAAAVGLDVQLAAQLAGHKLTDVPMIVRLNLSAVPTPDLVAELAKRSGVTPDELRGALSNGDGR